MSGRLSRREILGGAGKLALAGAALSVAGCDAPSGSARSSSPASANDVVAFEGDHQAGIATPAQERLLFATLDLLDDDREALQTMLQAWTVAARALTSGRPVGAVEPSDRAAAPGDTGEALSLGPANLTITVGLGPGVFVDARGRDRMGLAHLQPAPLAPLPQFGGGENIDPARSDGDVSVQCCADDAQVAFHAFHNLARLARDFATVRWTQLGFGRTSSTSKSQPTLRNLQGFKDGTNNLSGGDTAAMRDHVWVGDGDDPAWMRGGSYAVTRRIRMRLEVWDRSAISDQEATIGRAKVSGAPIGGHHEHDPPDLRARGAGGALVIADDAHIRLAAPSENDGVRILRRGYSFSDGVDPATGELDAGLFFIAYQRDPRRQFVPLQHHLASKDALNEYIQHVASGVFAVLPGVDRDEALGQQLFERT